MKSLTLIFDLGPVPKKASVFGRGYAFKHPRTRQFEADVARLARLIWKQPALTGSLYVQVVFTFQTKQKSRWGKCHAMRPDLDNLSKSFFDPLQGIVFVDDKQIVDMALTKYWGERGSISLTIGEI